jgi:hypothetical protein
MWREISSERERFVSMRWREVSQERQSAQRMQLARKEVLTRRERHLELLLIQSPIASGESCRKSCSRAGPTSVRLSTSIASSGAATTYRPARAPRGSAKGSCLSVVESSEAAVSKFASESTVYLCFRIVHLFGYAARFPAMTRFSPAVAGNSSSAMASKSGT